MGKRTDHCREFGNGNIHVYVSNAEMNEFVGQYGDVKAVLALVLSEIDTEFSGEPWSVGNFDVGYTLYNGRRNCQYYLFGEDIKQFQKTGKLKLTATEGGKR